MERTTIIETIKEERKIPNLVFTLRSSEASDLLEELRRLHPERQDVGYMILNLEEGLAKFLSEIGR